MFSLWYCIGNFQIKSCKTITRYSIRCKAQEYASGTAVRSNRLNSHLERHVTAAVLELHMLKAFLALLLSTVTVSFPPDAAKQLRLFTVFGVCINSFANYSKYSTVQYSIICGLRFTSQLVELFSVDYS